MKQLTRNALLALFALTCAGTAFAADASRDDKLKAVRPAAKGEESPPWVPPCTLARAVSEKLGRLAPQVKPLPNDKAFGVANGDVRLVVACGMSSDEIYTYRRLLSNLGIGLLTFRGDEAPQKIVQELADQLRIAYRREPAPQGPLTFVFPDQGPKRDGVRLTINAAPSPSATATREQASEPATHPAENLWELYLLARASDPELGRSRSRAQGSKADTEVIRSSLIPHLGTSFAVNWLDQTAYNNPSAPSAQHVSLFGYNYDVSATAPLLHVPVLYNLAASAASMRSEEAGVTAAHQYLIAKLGDSYFAILKARADEAIAREEISRVKQALDQAQAFLKAGTGDIIAVYEAQARLDSVIADLSRSESVLRIAEQRLSSIVGKPVSAISDYLPKDPRLPEPNDLEWWLSTMEERDPQIRQAREGLAGMEQQTKSARAEYLPVLDANAGFSLSKGNQYPPEVETHQWRVGATLSLPIFSGGETSARIRRATANESERRYALDEVREQRRENVKQAYFNLTYNVNLVKALEQKEASSQMQLNAVRKGRSIGTRTAIDLLNAEAAYSIAMRDLKNALYDNIVRVIQLKAAAGILDEDDIKFIWSPKSKR